MSELPPRPPGTPPKQGGELKTSNAGLPSNQAMDSFGMFKRIAILPTVLLLFLSPSFAQDTNNKSEGEEPAIPAVSVIRGRVVYEDSGLPVRRATIGLIETRRFSDVVGSKTLTYQSIVPERFVLTDENGNFKFRHVMAGSYYPSVNMRLIHGTKTLTRSPYSGLGLI